MRPPAFLALLLAIACLTATVGAAEPSRENDAAPAPRHVVVEMNCTPDDSDAVRATLRTALALRQDESRVTLFIDLAATPLAEPSTTHQPAKLRQETDRLFAKLREAGVTVLVCPHCAKEQALTASRLREGLRFTTREELDAVRGEADQIYKYRSPDPKATEEPPQSVDARKV